MKGREKGGRGEYMYTCTCIILLFFGANPKLSNPLVKLRALDKTTEYPQNT
jgi:hypothetical protein